MTKRKDVTPDIEGEPLDNGVLIRFLRAHGFDLDKSVHAYKQYLEWRKEFNIDSVRHREPSTMKIFNQHVRSEILGHDSTGRPVLYESFDNINLDEFSSSLSMSAMQDILVYRNEKLLEACRRSSKESGQLVYDVCYVIDLGGKFRIPEEEAMTLFKEINHLDRWYDNSDLYFTQHWRITDLQLFPGITLIYTVESLLLMPL
jgi:hypothetical protein